jgi:hypothetical protein
MPDTPAGRTLAALLDAFNSGNRERMEAYYKQYEPTKSVASQMPFRERTGGIELLKIQTSDRLFIEYLVKERNSETRALARLEVSDTNPPVVTSFQFSALPNGVTTGSFKIDAATRARVIAGALAKLNEFYVFPDVAKQMESALGKRQQNGEYDAVDDGGKFARLLTEHLQEVSHDKHLRVNFSPAPLPPMSMSPNRSPETLALYRKQLERSNCGFDKVERLTNNIGYMKFNAFADPEICAPTVAAAMTFLANVDALIVDLRDNGGGSPMMVALISSYLFAAPTHLNDLWQRNTGTTQEFWTRSDVSGKQLNGKPMYVLTSSRTFSGAEEFSYNLQALKRATIVGEATGGGAHPVTGHRLDDQFTLGVPSARAINPITKTNWEGTGVVPDVKTTAADALSTAQSLAGKSVPTK